MTEYGDSLFKAAMSSPAAPLSICSDDRAGADTRGAVDVQAKRRSLEMDESRGARL